MNGTRGASARPRSNRSRNRLRYGALALAVGTSAAGGLMILAAGTANAAAGGSAHDKVYVCKYVGTPGVDETLKKGNDGFVIVNVNSIKNFAGIGSYFNDAQGRSYVLAYYPTDPAPTAADCPGGNTPSTPVTPAAPTATTPDCINQVETVTPGSQTGIVWTPSGSTNLNPGQSVTYTAAAAAGFAIPVGAQTSWTFTNTFNVAQCSSSSGSSSSGSSTAASSTAASSTAASSTAASSSSASSSFAISGSAASSGAAGTTAAAPIPAGVSAGLHTPIANAGLRAWGTVLLLLGGIGGLMAGLWPTTRRRVH